MLPEDGTGVPRVGSIVNTTNASACALVFVLVLVRLCRGWVQLLTQPMRPLVRLCVKAFAQEALVAVFKLFSTVHLQMWQMLDGMPRVGVHC